MPAPQQPVPFMQLIALHFPLTSTRPHQDVMLAWRQANINRTVSVLQYYNGAQSTTSSYRSVEALILLDLARCLPSASVFSVFTVRYIFFWFHPFLYLFVS